MKELIWTLATATFVAGKVIGGMYLSTWSWWWLLMPLVPVIGSVIHGWLR